MNIPLVETGDPLPPEALGNKKTKGGGLILQLTPLLETERQPG